MDLEDVRQILPFVLHDKLSSDSDAPFFDAPGNGVFRTRPHRLASQNSDLSCADYDRLNLDRDDPVADLGTEFRRGLDGLSESETRSRLVRIERLITEWSKGRKLYGHIYDDVLKLKYLHQRYTNYLRWLKTQ